MSYAVTNIESGRVCRVAWTSSPANYDIMASFPLKASWPGLAAPSEGLPCRRLIAGSTGNLVITGLDGVDVTLPVSFAGQVFDIQATNLKNTSTATNVVVVW